LAKKFFRSLTLLIALNLLVKPLWIFGIDRQVQNIVGHASYGAYFALMNLTLILNILLDIGITPFFNRTVAADPHNGPGLFPKALTWKSWLTLFYAIIVLAVALLSGVRDLRLLLSLILLQVLTGFNMFFRGYLSATQHFTADAVVSVTDKFIVILVAGSLILFPGLFGGMTIDRFVWIQIAALVMSVSLGLIFLVRRGKGKVESGSSGLDRSLFLDSLPYALNVFLMGFMARSDGYLLERMHPDGQVQAGIYATGFRLLDAVNMVGYLFAGFLLPYIARHWPDRKVVDNVLLQCRHFLVFTGTIAAAFVFGAPEWTDRLLYHDASAYGAGIIRLVMLCLPFLSLTHIYGTLLTAVHEIGAFVRISLFFALLNLVLNLILIPRYGAMACAGVALFTQSLNAATLMYTARKRTGIYLHGAQLALYAGGGLLLLVAVRLILHFGLPLIPSTTLVVALLSLIFLRMIRFDPKDLVRSLH
jgi:O-antigen/teichoic acid export membrane protein